MLLKTEQLLLGCKHFARDESSYEGGYGGGPLHTHEGWTTLSLRESDIVMNVKYIHEIANIEGLKRSLKCVFSEDCCTINELISKYSESDCERDIHARNIFSGIGHLLKIGGKFIVMSCSAYSDEDLLRGFSILNKSNVFRELSYPEKFDFFMASGGVFYPGIDIDNKPQFARMSAMEANELFLYYKGLWVRYAKAPMV